MRTLLALALTATLVGCFGSDVGRSIGCGIGDSLDSSAATQARVTPGLNRDSTGAVGATFDSTPKYVVVLEDGVLKSSPLPSSGDSPSDSCPPQRNIFIEDDGGLHQGSASLEVTDVASEPDGGQSASLSVTDVHLLFADGGQSPQLPDATVSGPVR